LLGAGAHQRQGLDEDPPARVLQAHAHLARLGHVVRPAHGDRVIPPIDLALQEGALEQALERSALLLERHGRRQAEREF
jgi:hypothetical protein